MFKVSKEAYTNGCDAVNHSDTYGRYTQLDEQQVHADYPRCFVAPELSQVDRVKITGFPSAGTIVAAGTTVDFLIIKNGAPGNVAVQVVPPSCSSSIASKSPAPTSRHHLADIIELSADNYVVHVPVVEVGTYRVHIRFNDVELPQSPLQFCSGGRTDDIV